ncbi:MAG: hypothetical protein WCC64_16425 [Aliidongia sp.]
MRRAVHWTLPGRQCHIHPMIDRDPTTLTLDDWITELDASEAEVELVPGDVVLAELEQQLARLEARLQSAPAAQVITRR